MMTRARGLIKIIDFGLVASDHSLDQAGCHGSAGTPGYMAPEIDGEDTRYERAADHYSVGITILGLIRGHDDFIPPPPLENEDSKTHIARVWQQLVKPLSSGDAHVVGLIEFLCDPRPMNRWSCVCHNDDLIRGLEWFEATTSVDDEDYEDEDDDCDSYHSWQQ